MSGNFQWDTKTKKTFGKTHEQFNKQFNKQFNSDYFDYYFLEKIKFFK